MTFKLSSAVLVVLLLVGPSLAQAPPTTVPTNKPSLRRDRTQRVLYPKIIQCEDERTVTHELVEMVTRSHGGAKRRAILALGRIGYPSGLTVLIDLLNSGGKTDDLNAEFRALAAFSLGEIEHQYAAASLLDHLNPDIERSPLVRARAAEALGKIGSNKLSIESIGQYGVSGIAATIAERLPSPAQQPSDDDKRMALLGLTALMRLKQPATVPALAAQLSSPDSEVRWYAANALARIRDGIANAVPQLLPLTEDKNVLVRAHAARALGVARSKAAVEPLIKLLGDKDDRVTANAINALGAIGDPRAVEALLPLGTKLLEGYRSFDRDRFGMPSQQNLLLLIASALGQIGDSRGLPFLKAFRAACAPYGAEPEIEIALARFGDDAVFNASDDPTKLIGGWKAVSARAQGLGKLATDRARSALNQLFTEASSSSQYLFAVPEILNALAAVKIDGLERTLISQLKANDVIIRATAATLLGDSGGESEETIQALDSAYKAARTDKVNDARIAVLEALEKLKHPLSVQVLAEQTRDSDYVVRLRASEFLRESKHEVTTPLSIGKVDTGHDKVYWQRMARLSESATKPIALIHTRKGDIRIELYPEDAPMTVDNFVQLARRGFYNGLTFMRVVPNFVIQGGDPRGDGNGGPGYQIRCEINLRKYGEGTVGMALAGKDTGGSQFFITHSPQPHLDGGYTVFGQVVGGMDVVNKIARDDRIDRIEIVEPQSAAAGSREQ
jgi:peptidyl-prolyl cis-trans isomerase B (cyclophilin B)